MDWLWPMAPGYEPRANRLIEEGGFKCLFKSKM
ncbi:hypothetical protein ATHSA_1021 [Athalassotoga saccharophila]|nr:hypothetical protein ATHSA_1021 [Athalassotoga saccharophila]